MEIKPIFLPILYTTPETEAKELAGVEIAREEYDARNLKFYEIDVVAPDYENGEANGMTKIFVGGETFICSLSPEEVAKKIIPLRHVSN